MVKYTLCNIKSISYTNTGKVSSITDENGNETNYKYDDIDRLVEVIDAKGNKTDYVYDAVGNLTEIHKYAGVTDDTLGNRVRKED